eukprot:360384-Chlamydomonas_euryale.AAC.5
MRTASRTCLQEGWKRAEGPLRKHCREDGVWDQGKDLLHLDTPDCRSQRAQPEWGRCEPMQPRGPTPSAPVPQAQAPYAHLPTQRLTVCAPLLPFSFTAPHHPPSLFDFHTACGPLPPLTFERVKPPALFDP